ncbi:tripartite tricarboxylate transporter TctB family protein [Neorhizobium sp. T786]|uniref:tripartite tricarboxylate transporter TctB family protein n=1 Tax=Pseudorhizobium xiangyangii TaxID=2883104 RepID=UPI001CFF8321|nr:tripartite tricarboxylate transporter TctB family protein [Neorhizobium xiangyangii]MCB5203781.1 tripartite tricarboxylate transporter TctB family protein [Neorhizobium xiangyangii]
MYIRDIREVLSSLVCVLTGISIIVMSLGYELGTAFNMGPGYFPLLLGIVLLVTGIFIAAGAVSWRVGTAKTTTSFDRRSLWALVVVAATFVGFAALLETCGLALTCFVVLSAAGMTSRLLRPLEAFLTAFVLSSISVILFVYVLDLQIRAWPW